MTLASAPIRVSASAAALQAPESVAAGSRFRVSWEGPGNNRDLITIVASAADERSYANYTYTRDGNPLKLSAPDLSGRYEIRYLAGQSRATLARIPVIVEAVTATLQAPPEVAAGAEIRVVWEGPDNDRDLITIVAADADSGSYANYEYTRKGTPLKLSAPDQPGSYEIRYLTAQTRSTLAGIAIEVRAVEADLEAPERVPAGSKFKVAWTGPDNKRDFVTIVEPQTEERKYGNYAYTRTGNPLKLLAPDTPGSYEIRYLTAQTRRTLARRPVTVE
jgi:Ca-activated chloride channel family protein